MYYIYTKTNQTIPEIDGDTKRKIGKDMFLKNRESLKRTPDGNGCTPVNLNDIGHKWLGDTGEGIEKLTCLNLISKSSFENKNSFGILGTNKSVSDLTKIELKELLLAHENKIEKMLIEHALSCKQKGIGFYRVSDEGVVFDFVENKNIVVDKETLDFSPAENELLKLQDEIAVCNGKEVQFIKNTDLGVAIVSPQNEEYKNMMEYNELLNKDSNDVEMKENEISLVALIDKRTKETLSIFSEKGYDFRKENVINSINNKSIDLHYLNDFHKEFGFSGKLKCEDVKFETYISDFDFLELSSLEAKSNLAAEVKKYKILNQTRIKFKGKLNKQDVEIDCLKTTIEKGVNQYDNIQILMKKDNLLIAEGYSAPRSYSSMKYFNEDYSKGSTISIKKMNTIVKKALKLNQKMELDKSLKQENKPKRNKLKM